MTPSFVGSDERILGPQRIIAIVATLAEDGVPPARTLANSGLTEEALRVPAMRVSSNQIATVFVNAASLASNTTAALRAGSRMHLTAYGMWGYGLLSSPTHAELMEFAAKYAPSTYPMVGATGYSRDQDMAVNTYEVFLAAEPGDALYQFLIEFVFAAHLRLGRDLYGPGFSFISVGACYPPPEHAGFYVELLNCPVQFNQPHNEVRVALDWAQRPFGMPDSSTHAMMREVCQRTLEDLPQVGSLSSQVRRVLIEDLPWRFPTIEPMALQLAITPRALRRQLELEGTSYRVLLADVRKVLAIRYLRETRMTAEEIASRLGYSDASNFRHAFVRWTGANPKDYRTRKPGRLHSQAACLK